jgi:hypothetical protein
VEGLSKNINPHNKCDEMMRHIADYTQPHQYEDTHDKPKKADSMGPSLSSEIFVHTIERTIIEQHFKNRTLKAIVEQHKIIFLYPWTEMITFKFISTASPQTP